METLTMAQALRHMADRAEQGSDTPWKDLQFLSYSAWVPLNGSVMLKDLVTMKIGLKPQPKLVNGTECFPHLGALVQGETYYIPSPGREIGFYGVICSNTNNPYLRLILKRGCVYTTKEGALVEARAQGWLC